MSGSPKSCVLGLVSGAPVNSLAESNHKILYLTCVFNFEAEKLLESEPEERSKWNSKEKIYMELDYSTKV